MQAVNDAPTADTSAVKSKLEVSLGEIATLQIPRSLFADALDQGDGRNDFLSVRLEGEKAGSLPVDFVRWEPAADGELFGTVHVTGLAKNDGDHTLYIVGYDTSNATARVPVTLKIGEKGLSRAGEIGLSIAGGTLLGCALFGLGALIVLLVRRRKARKEGGGNQQGANAVGDPRFQSGTNSRLAANAGPSSPRGRGDRGGKIAGAPELPPTSQTVDGTELKRVGDV